MGAIRSGSCGTRVCCPFFFWFWFCFRFVFFAQVGPGGEEEWKLGGKGARQFWRRGRWRPEAAGNVGADSAEESVSALLLLPSAEASALLPSQCRG